MAALVLDWIHDNNRTLVGSSSVKAAIDARKGMEALRENGKADHSESDSKPTDEIVCPIAHRRSANWATTLRRIGGR
jgi:hypothetical protein